jgi:hypothetical protein
VLDYWITGDYLSTEARPASGALASGGLCMTGVVRPARRGLPWLAGPSRTSSRQSADGGAQRLGCTVPLASAGILVLWVCCLHGVPRLPVPRAWLAGPPRRSRGRRECWMLAIVLPGRCWLVRCRRPMHLLILPDVLLAHLALQSAIPGATSACCQPPGPLPGATARRASDNGHEGRGV